MSDLTPKAYLSNIFQFLAVFALMLLLFESLARLIILNGQFPQSHLIQFDRKWALASQKDTSKIPSILFLGSSHIATGLVPELITQELDSRHVEASVINLGVSGNTPDLSLLLLQQAIRAKGRPALVIHDVAPPWMFNKKYYQSEASAASRLRKTYLGQCVVNHSQNPNVLQNAQCSIQKWLWLVRYQETLKGLILKLPRVILQPASLQTFQANAEPTFETSPRGWFPIYEFHTQKELKERLGQPNVRNGNSLQVLYQDFQWDEQPLKNLIAFCQQQQIPLILVWTPEHPIRQQYNHRFHLDDSLFESHFKHFEALPGLRFWDYHAIHLPERYYQNTDHLNAEGAIFFSRLLSTQLFNALEMQDQRTASGTIRGPL